MFRQAWEDTLAEDPLRDPYAEGMAKVRHHAHQLRYLLTGFGFAIAGVYLALAIATVLQGTFDLLSLTGAALALASAFLGVHGLRRRSFPLCAGALAILLAWTAVHIVA